MINKLKFNKISTKIENFDGYITDIGDIFGKLKNITIKVKIVNKIICIIFFIFLILSFNSLKRKISIL